MHRLLKATLAGAALSGLLAGCATTVDWGGPLGHYRYSYDSRPIVYGNDDSDHYDTYHAPAIVDRPAVTYHDEDDDD
jgi:hypothetical protein